MSPVLKAPPFAVAVWVVPPLFFHATVCPTLTVAGLGEKDELPLMPVIVIVTSAAVPGDMGFDLLLLLLQDARNTPMAMKATTKRMGTIFFIQEPPDNPAKGAVAPDDLAKQDHGDALFLWITVLNEID